MSFRTYIRSTYTSNEPPLQKAVKALVGFLILVLVAVMIHSIIGISYPLSIVILTLIVLAWINFKSLRKQR